MNISSCRRNERHSGSIVAMNSSEESAVSGSNLVGRTELQRIPARQRLKEKPELASLGPAYIHQAIADTELVFQNWQRAVSLAFHRQASATI
jgi:hypothetical protein